MILSGHVLSERRVIMKLLSSSCMRGGIHASNRDTGECMYGSLHLRVQISPSISGQVLAIVCTC